MKTKFLFSILLGSALTVSAQGYKDGVEYFKADQFANAKTILEKTLNDASTDKSMSYYYLGQIAIQDKDLATAKADFDKGISLNVSNPYNYVGLGSIELLNGNSKAADEQFKQARDLGKKDADVYVDIARAYFNADPVKYDKELTKMLEKAYKTNSKSAAYFILLGDMAVGMDAQAVGRAASNYDNAILVDPNDAAAYVKYSRLYEKVNPQFSISKMQEYLANNPNSALAQRELAERLYDSNQWIAAAVQYGEYIKNPNHFQEDVERYAVLLYYGEKYQESFDVAGSVLASNPSSFLMQRIQFLDLASMEQYEQAQKFAEDFFANNQGEHFTSNDYVTYGDVLTALGNDSIALDEYNKAIEVSPDRADLYEKLSTAYRGMKNYAKAAEAFETYVAKNEKPSTNDYYLLAGLYMTYAATEPSGSETRAVAADKGLEYIEVALTRAPENMMVMKRKAGLLRAKNDNAMCEEAAEAYKATLALLDNDPTNFTENADAYIEAYSLLGDYYNSIKETDTAKYYYGKLLELQPENEVLRQFIDKMK